MSTQVIEIGSREELELDLELLDEEAERRRYLRDPVAWVSECLGEHVWSKQCEIMESVRDNRLTAVPSCHQSGKSFTAARIAAWWIECHPPGEAIVITTATTATQVADVLWKEINRVHAKGNLSGRMNKTSWMIIGKDGNEEWVAKGLKPADDNSTAFQGRHARFVLLIYDEAYGISKTLFEGGSSIITTDEARWLLIGNPLASSGEFCEACKPGSGWNVIQISAFDTPNFTGEDVPVEVSRVLVGRIYETTMRKKYGVKNPYYVARILGKFPVSMDDGLIPFQYVQAALDRSLEPKTEQEKSVAERWENELGVDVGAGGDKNVCCHRRGPIFRIRRRDQEPDTMKSCGNLLSDLRETGATAAKVDYIGIGRGMVDRAKEQGAPVIGVQVGESAKHKENFVNLRAEGYWGLRERFFAGEIDIDDENLARQLADIKYFRTSAGKIQIESKDDIKKRNDGESPDEADACMMASIPAELLEPLEQRIGGLLW